MSTPSTSDRIVAAALDLLEREGADAVSMRRIAKAASITAMAIYYHFRNRDELLRTIVDREFSKFLATFQQGPPRRSHEQRLLHSLDAYIHYSFRHPRIFDYMFSERRPAARKYPDDFKAGRSPTLNALEDLLSSAIKEGYLKRADAWELALELWAHVHGYVMLHRGGRFSLSESDFTALIHRSIKRLLHGLKI